MPYQQLLVEHPHLLIDFRKIQKPLSFKKSHLLHTENKICNHSYFIEKGAARIYYYKDGKDITSYFAFEGQAITAIDSLLQRKRSKYSIELLEDSTLFSISYHELENLFQKSALHERFGRLYLQEIYFDMVERIEDLQFYSARERYNNLIEKYPHIIQRVQLKHISSYLGITQETLSRIRGK